MSGRASETKSERFVRGGDDDDDDDERGASERGRERETHHPRYTRGVRWWEGVLVSVSHAARMCEEKKEEKREETRNLGDFLFPHPLTHLSSLAPTHIRLLRSHLPRVASPDSSPIQLQPDIS